MQSTTSKLLRQGTAWRGIMGLMAASLAVGASCISAKAASSTQTMTAATAASGTLSITAPGALNLGNSIAPGTTLSAVALGPVNWTDTLNDATASSVTVAAEDLCIAGPTSKISASTNFSISTSGSSIGTTGGNTGSNPTVGGGASPLGGASGCSTYSSSATLANASATTEGTWSESGNTITVVVPANLLNSGAMTSTIQYTVTG